MKRFQWTKRTTVAAVALLAVTAIGLSQIRDIIKVVGVGAAVQRFGGEINRGFNSITGHRDTNERFSKVVPIFTFGTTKEAIGAAQVMGTRAQVEKVTAVASPEVEVLGRELRLRALIPVQNLNVSDSKQLQAVPGVGVTGIVDLKL